MQDTKLPNLDISKQDCKGITPKCLNYIQLNIKSEQTVLAKEMNKIEKKLSMFPIDKNMYLTVFSKAELVSAALNLTRIARRKGLDVRIVKEEPKQLRISAPL